MSEKRKKNAREQIPSLGKEDAKAGREEEGKKQAVSA
jgi:hypothetical protein